VEKVWKKVETPIPVDVSAASPGGICHVPVKLGSKRLVVKNIIPVGNRPAFIWPTVAALDSHAFDDVVLTSEIVEFLHRLKGECPELALTTLKHQNPSSVVQVTHDVLADYSDGYEKQVSIALATAVMLTPEDINGAIALSRSTGDPVMLVTKFMGDAVRIKNDHVEPAGDLKSRNPLYLDAGAFYTFPPGQFKKVKSMYVKNMRPYYVPRLRAVDIDTEEDLYLAEILFEAQSRWKKQDAAS
jgi:CMP-N-acetylneuraminic acid synthetase